MNNILFFILGFIFGQQHAKINTKVKNNTEDTDERPKPTQPDKSPDSSSKKKGASAKIRKKFKKYYKVKSSKPINPEDISVDIQPKPEKNKSLVLAVLWAHFEACRQNRLEENKPAPWEQIKKKGDKFKDLWIEFLNLLITDKDWVNWIKDPDEVKKRSLKAYSEMIHKSLSSDNTYTKETPGS